MSRNDTCDKRVISKICKEISKLKLKQQPIFSQQKIWIDTSPKKIDKYKRNT